jgi:tetratricopeptide (TPR) repeat protein
MAAWRSRGDRAKRWGCPRHSRSYATRPGPYLAETLSPRRRQLSGRRRAGNSSSSSPRLGSDGPTARVLAAEAQAKAGRPREALEQYQALVRAATTHALAPQALYRIGELSLRLNRPADAEAAWTTLRRDFPQNALVGPSGLATARLHEQRKQWEPALQVAQSVADLKGEERSAALLVVGQSALQLRRNAEAAQAYHTVVVEAPPTSKRYFEGLAGPRCLARGRDRQGRRQAGVPGDRRHQPGSGSRTLGQGAPRRVRRPGPTFAGGPASQAQAQGPRGVRRGLR